MTELEYTCWSCGHNLAGSESLVAVCCNPVCEFSPISAKATLADKDRARELAVELGWNDDRPSDAVEGE